MEAGLGERIAHAWAKRLGCAAELFSEPGTHVIPAPPGARRLYLLARPGTLLLQGETGVAALLAEAPRGADGLPTPESVETRLGARLERSVGPARLGYRSHAPEPPAARGEVRRLAGADGTALARLRAAVRDEEWEHAGLDHAEEPLHGVFADGRLLAAAGFERQGAVAHLGVLTHPAARGRGLGTWAVAAAAGAAEAAGLLLQYQTLVSNRPSVRISTRLGFAPWATSLAARLAGAPVGSGLARGTGVPATTAPPRGARLGEAPRATRRGGG